MKITFLGTAAAEGFPAVFCCCAYCQEARRLGGKNIRTRSQALINDDLLVDLPADTYSHFLNNQIEADRIPNLLITHSHQDHFYLDELSMRQGAFAHDMRAPELKVYCNEGAYRIKQNYTGEQNNVCFEMMKPYQTVQFGNYTVTALPARHYEGDGALIYIIQDDKTMLYAHDTGFFFDEVFDYIKNSGVVFDLITWDCCNVDIPISDEGTHMGLENIQRAIERLKQMGAVHKDTVHVINHFSHNANPLQHVLEQRVATEGYRVAYDGYSVEF